MEAKYRTPTCSRCKIRKTRCDGQSTCHACSTAGERCEYVENERAVLELRKGAACLSCRRKKKKCDGKLPCHTCATTRKKIHCEYPNETPAAQEKAHQSVLHTVIHPLDSASPTPTVVSSAASGSSNGPESTLDMDSSPEIPLDVFHTSFADPEFSQSATHISLADVFQAREMFLADAIKRGMNVSDTLVLQEDERAYRESLCEVLCSTPSSDLPHIPLFQFPTPNSAARDEDEITPIRTIFLAHRTQLGLSVRDSVLEALCKGILNTLHPALLHACQLMGYMLARHPGQDDREAEEMRLTFRLVSLQQLGIAASPLVYLQTATLLSLYLSNQGDIQRSREILADAGKMVVNSNLDTTLLEPVAAPADTSYTGFNPTPMTLVAETQAAFSQLVYLDLSQTILLKLPSALDLGLRARFKMLMKTPNPNAEINFVRAKSAFLLLEAEELAEQWHQSGLDAEAAAEWQARYWAVMEALDKHRSFLSLTSTRFAFFPNFRTFALTLKLCTVLALTGLSVLLTLFADAQADLCRKNHEAVVEVISISATFSEEDCEHLDPILSACWKSVTRTLDHGIWLGPKAVARSMHDIPAMARIIRERSRTLQRVLPCGACVTYP